jgi:hypothetical protein
MKTQAILFATLALVRSSVYAQGFVYDQQSATNGIATFGSPIQPNQPIGQSFTPTLSSIDFVELEFGNSLPNKTNATIAVKIWSGSIGGTLLGSTDPVFIPSSFTDGSTNFSFSASVSLVPGTTYYLQPVILSGGNNSWTVLNDFYNYSGGAMIVQGAPQGGGLDLWFREGMVVPEPSSMALLALFGAGYFAARRKHRKLQK